jgi:hypothetical protein
MVSPRWPIGTVAYEAQVNRWTGFFFGSPNGERFADELAASLIAAVRLVAICRGDPVTTLDRLQFAR